MCSFRYFNRNFLTFFRNRYNARSMSNHLHAVGRLQHLLKPPDISHDPVMRRLKRARARAASSYRLGAPHLHFLMATTFPFHHMYRCAARCRATPPATISWKRPAQSSRPTRARCFGRQRSTTSAMGPVSRFTVSKIPSPVTISLFPLFQFGGYLDKHCQGPAASAILAYYLCVRAATHEILKDPPVPVDVSDLGKHRFELVQEPHGSLSCAFNSLVHVFGRKMRHGAGTSALPRCCWTSLGWTRTSRLPCAATPRLGRRRAGQSWPC